MFWSENVAKYVLWLEQRDKESGALRMVKFVCDSCKAWSLVLVRKTIPPCPCCGSEEVSIHDVREYRSKRNKKVKDEN